MALDPTTFLKAAFDFRKLPWWLLAAAVVTSGAALFTPAPWSPFLPGGGEHRTTLWLTFVFSSAAALLRLGGAAATRGAEGLRKRLRLRRAKKNLSCLSPEEKDLLAHYLQERTKTLLLPFDGRDGGVTHSLESAGIIHRASNIWELGPEGNHLIAYNLQPWAWKYLLEHPEMVLKLGLDEEFGTVGRLEVQSKRV